MKFQETFDFGYPRRVILRMFSDQDYYVAKYEKMCVAPEVEEVQADDGRFLITVRHALDASRLHLPAFLKDRIGSHLHLRQTDAWRLDAAEGRIDLEIEHAPVMLTADLHLADQGSSCRLTLDFDVRASVPLLGGKIEKAAAGPISRHIVKEMALTQEMAEDYL